MDGVKTLILMDYDYSEPEENILAVVFVTDDVDPTEFAEKFNDIRYGHIENGDDYDGDQQILNELKEIYGPKFLGIGNKWIINVT